MSVVLKAVERSKPTGLMEPAKRKGRGLPVGRRLLRLAGVIKDMPADWAEGHDRYIHRKARGLAS